MYRARHDEDEILVQEAREQLLEAVDDYTAEVVLESMAEEGMFRVPDGGF